MRAARHIVICLSAIGIPFVLSACGKQPPPAPPPPGVRVVTLSCQPVQNHVELPGRVQAVRTAEVRARVDGIVERRLYEEGTDIRAGQALFRIDPREKRADFASAQAQLNRARATATNAEQVVRRYAPLVKQNAISSQEYEAAIAASRQAAADVAAARSMVDKARLDLSYTVVTSPIAGRAGRAEVTEGALVSASQATLLTKVEQLSPVYINFSRSAADILRIRREIATGKLEAPNLSRVKVRLVLEDGSNYAQAGQIDFFDMSVDESTGTVSLRAEFPNPRRYLMPGQFVRALIETGVTRDGLLVPQRVVQVSPKGATVMVVDRESKAQVRPVKLGEMQGGNWVILGGLKAGERVIADGGQKVRPNAPVKVLPNPPAKR